MYKDFGFVTTLHLIIYPSIKNFQCLYENLKFISASKSQIELK